jgi:hypothetical protein
MREPLLPLIQATLMILGTLHLWIILLHGAEQFITYYREWKTRLASPALATFITAVTGVVTVVALYLALSQRARALPH